MDILAEYKAHLREIGKLSSALSLLHWDQRTQLPNGGQETRAEVVGKLTKMVFELSIADELGRYLEELEKREDLSEEESASLRVVGKAYRRNKAIPPDFYERFAIAASKAETTWEKAKERSDFLLFRPQTP
jgi:carboxypeptidase Taq